MLTNNIRKSYASLVDAKGRKATGWFMAQGAKCVIDTLDKFELVDLLATSKWQSGNIQHIATIVNASDLERISTLKTTPEVIAIYKIPEIEPTKPSTAELSLALDCVQDPGNLGTIIRVADWMGVENIFASEDTADVWNPKVIQATMGAISRVRVNYCDLTKMIRNISGQMPIYGTFLDGENIYAADLSKTGVIIMGNEGKGIRKEIEEMVSQKLLIPSYPPGRPTSESLNVAVATAITLAEFRRNG